ncbi:hypothetical protein J2792_002382 [Novosphingobium capsulatum]|uniref:Restriction alleviation protein, Lar family n=1 Tax=Novosphingobium capsulatum TaxID=13688 RepID=A0ABU1MMF2_9SPHN|nr:Lar family restriction alleviation protein [Novosphingobium capsulatum]MDR6511510.1 hypothetical protein [Novosphingobium capsulatum]
MTSQYLPPNAQAETVAAPVELLPCPFCKGSILRFVQPCSGAGLGIMCLDCHTTQDTRGTEAVAIAAWNTRTPDPLLVPALEALRKVDELTAGNSNWDDVRAILAQAKERGL